MLLFFQCLQITQKIVSLHCVFHSIRFKVNKKDWLSGIDSLFLCPYIPSLFLNKIPFEVYIGNHLL